MQFKNLLNDNDAVSPVIGVILMVAITVILAAVIGTFVLGLGDQVSNTSPQASFTFNFEEDASATTGADLAQSADSTAGTGDLTVTHDGGDSVEASQVTVKDDDGGSISPFSGTISAGSSVTFDAGQDDTVRVTWASSNGGDTATLGKWTGPEA